MNILNGTGDLAGRNMCFIRSKIYNFFYLQSNNDVTADATSQAVGVNSRRKTKIVCTIGPSTNTREMIWKLAETGMNVARMNMSHGDHQSHQKVIDLVKEYNAENTDGNTIAIMLDTKVCHG